MTRRRHSPAQIVLLLHRADDLLGRGRRIESVTEELGISPATFHRWRAQYGGIKAGDARRLAELDAENRRLRATVANQTLDLVMLRELVRTMSAELGSRVDLVRTLGERFDMSQRRACQVVGEPRTSIRRGLSSAARAADGPDPQDDPDLFAAEKVFADIHLPEGALG